MGWEAIVGVGGLVIAGLTLLATWKRDASKATADQASSSAERAVLMAKLDNISSGVDDVRLEQRAARDRADKMSQELAAVVSSCKSAHHRIDEQERRINQLQLHPPD